MLKIQQSFKWMGVFDNYCEIYTKVLYHWIVAKIDACVKILLRNINPILYLLQHLLL